MRNYKNNLRVKRLLSGMNQGELAKIAGCSRNTISSIETNQYGVSLDLAYRISLALGCTVYDIFPSEYYTMGVCE